MAPLTGLKDDAWRSGGIIHPYGPGNPQVVVLGSSHAMMYATVIDGICRRFQIPVAFLTANSTPAFFHATVNGSFPTAEAAKGFDEARKRFVREWRPDIVLVIDRWDMVVDVIAP